MSHFCFHESLLMVAPILEKYSDALQGLATYIAQLYLRGTEAAGLEPDVELLGRIAETLGLRTHGGQEE